MVVGIKGRHVARKICDDSMGLVNKWQLFVTSPIPNISYTSNKLEALQRERVRKKNAGC